MTQHGNEVILGADGFARSSLRVHEALPFPGFAFSLSQATFKQSVERLDERGIRHSGVKDRGFMDSIYFKDPLGLLIELASYRFDPPAGQSHADVLLEAHQIRVERGDHHIGEIHLADAIEELTARTRRSLSDDRSPRDPYR